MSKLICSKPGCESRGLGRVVRENMIIVAEIAYQALKDANMRETILDLLDVSDEFGEEVLATLHEVLGERTQLHRSE